MKREYQMDVKVEKDFDDPKSTMRKERVNEVQRPQREQAGKQEVRMWRDLRLSVLGRPAGLASGFASSHFG